MAVDRAAVRSAVLHAVRGCGLDGVAARFEQEDEIEIAVIVRLAAAELAEREHDRFAAVALAVGEALPVLPD